MAKARAASQLVMCVVLLALAPLIGLMFALLGVGLLASSGDARRLWWNIGIACDLADAGSAMVELAAGRVPRNGRTAVMLLASPFLGAALGAAALAAGDE